MPIFTVNPPPPVGVRITSPTGGSIHFPGNEPIWVLLGAFGDICAMLPFFYDEARKRGKPCSVVVAKTYAPIFEGVSYVNPIVFDGDYSKVNDAMQFVRSQNRNFNTINPPPMIVQAYGQTGFKRETSSFVKEMWRFVNRVDDWDRYPLVFDKRDADREQKLITDHISSKRDGRNRVMLVAAEGRSSPFPHRQELVGLLTESFPDWQILDLSTVKAEKPYDLLGLFDRAQLLFAADTFQLHLSRASHIPVFAFHVNKPTPWFSSPPYLNQIARLSYDEFPSRKEWIVNFVRGRMVGMRSAHKTTLLHIYSDYGRFGEALHRHQLASASWFSEYDVFGKWRQLPVSDNTLDRTSAMIGDTDKSVPFLKDIINTGISDAGKVNDGDVIVFTNDDTCFVPGLTQAILRGVSMYGAVHAHRWDFMPKLSRLLYPHEMRAGRWYPGTDLIAFTVGWWRAHQDELPDFLISYEAWDWIFRELVKKHGGGELYESIYHEWHSSFWAEKRLENRGNIYNRGLAREWLKSNNLPLKELEGIT